MFIPASLREVILKVFYDNPVAGNLGIRKTYSGIYNSCLFSKMRKTAREYEISFINIKVLIIKM